VAILGREQILAADDIRRELVEVPEWGGSVWVRGMTGRERDDYEAGAFTIKPDPQGGRPEVVPSEDGVRARLVAFCCVDEAGQRIFSEEDAKVLGQKSAAALERVFDVGRRLSGVGADALQDAEGNSDGGPSASSATDSPSPLE
jgi:hypothetical protein